MKTNATYPQFQTTYPLSDILDHEPPHYIEWELTVEFNARECTEGDGSKSIEVDGVRCELLSTVVWCVDSGADVLFDTAYAERFNRWIKARLDDRRDGLRESVEAKCRRHFDDAGA